MYRSHRQVFSMGLFWWFYTTRRMWWRNSVAFKWSHYFKLKMALGRGTNNYAELNSLRLLLIFFLEKGCRKLHIFGDWKIVINWFNQQLNYHVHTLRNMLEEVIILKSQFDSVIYRHIYGKGIKFPTAYPKKLHSNILALGWYMKNWHRTTISTFTSPLLINRYRMQIQYDPSQLIVGPPFAYFG